MKSHTIHRTFNTEQRREFIRITDDVQAAVDEAGIAEGLAARQLLPDPGDYRHHRGGEDNGDAHLKNLLVHNQVVLPITEGKLDLGPWQAVFYCEFDGERAKRLVIKVIGE